MSHPILDSYNRWAGKPVDLFAKLMEQDERLVAKGWPPISPWWREQLRAFYASGKRRFVPRVGRRGGKSSTMCRVAIVETLHGPHSIPPGDVGYFAVVSVDVREASARLVTIKAILDALGISYRPADHGVVVEGRPLGFRVYTATISGVSGFTAVGFLADELAKWRDNDTGANPATEVLRSIGPTLATQPHAKSFLLSSPFSTIDAHAEAYDMGDTPAQMVACAATWVANPSLTEEYTHTLEPDETTWQREYGAVPMNAGTQFWFDAEAVKVAAEKPLEMPAKPEPGVTVTAGGDLAFISDSAALVVGHTIGDWLTARFRVADILEVQPKPGAPLMPGAVVDTFAARLLAHNVKAMMADGHYKMTVIEHFNKAQLAFLDAPSTVSDPFVRLRVLIHGGRCELPQHPKLLAQLKAVMFRPTANNAISIIQPRSGGGHGDLVSALVLAAFQQGGYRVPMPDGKGPDAIDQAMFERAKKQQRDKRRQAGDWWAKR